MKRNRTRNLVPGEPGKAPNYMCTWAAQNYVCENPIRDMHERLIFGPGGWINFYPKIQGDVFFLLDNGYQVNGTLADGRCNFAAANSTELDPAKFPSFPGEPRERLKKLNDRLKAAGWRGLGLWLGTNSDEAFYRERLGWSRYAGVGYWKVDGCDREFVLNRLGRELYPELIFEHADSLSTTINTGANGTCAPDYGTGHRLKCLQNSNVMRIYDIDQPLRLVTALGRVVSALSAAVATTDASGIINCEDEVYVGAALGCSVGIFRHPLIGLRPGGDRDVFMAGPQQYKKRMDEVTRAVRWHRIAPPFGACTVPVNVDERELSDSWTFRDGDTWEGKLNNLTLVQSAPARVARGLALPEVECDGEPPCVLASRHPNGAVAVAALGRIHADKGLFNPPADVSLKLAEMPPAIGVFGRFRSLTLVLKKRLPAGARIWMQDLAGDAARDVTARVTTHGGRLTLSGQLITRLGLSAATPGDVSDPGCVVLLEG